jgi:hypothetical protein
MSPFGRVLAEYVVSTRYEGHGGTGVPPVRRPKATERWTATLRVAPERGNPPSALSGKAGASDQAASLGGVGCREPEVRKKRRPHCNGEDHK